MIAPGMYTVTQHNYELTCIHDVWNIEEATSYLAAYNLRGKQFDTQRDANEALFTLKMGIQSVAWKSMESGKLINTPCLYTDYDEAAGREVQFVDIANSTVIPANFVKWAHEKKLDMPEAFKKLLPTQEDKTEKSLRPDQQARERCRVIAEMLWDQDPTIKIKEMTVRPEVEKYGTNGAFTPKTVYGWITDLAPKNRNKNKETDPNDSAEQ
jgi:hypothetical protein